MNELDDILASRLNFDVIVFRGNTRQEMIFIGLISLAITVLIMGTLAKLFIGMFLVGVGVSFPLAIPVGFAFASIMQKLKDNKPKGYVKQQFILWLDKHGIKHAPFIRRSGKWQVRRVDL
ncbi:MAG: TIGR03750 family conjugal transfer protein [Gammaproteobacteria bacterium]|nr:TIGR03750 family conjugal transfer protein [Gammaproteobacteria bacterium]MBY0544837.1 TIGR03750 family conjugal transfer protein [Gammaproteobacteria bacterium]